MILARDRQRSPTKSLVRRLSDIYSVTDGAWYDFSIPYLTQLSDGTTPVTTAEQPIGRAIDRSGRANHGIQATAAARPTYRVDANGRQYAAFLGTDDNMTCATGGGGSAGFCAVAAINPTVGVAQILLSDAGTNTGYVAYITTGGAIRLYAGNGIAYTTIDSAASMVSGSPYVITYRDNGTNLMVSVNGGAWATIARPVVVSGTAGFTVGKANGSASGYVTAGIYHLAYYKGSGLTDAQVRAEQFYAASKIGITL